VSMHARMVAVADIPGIKAPNLVVAPTEYSQRFMDQFANQLRLYFNTNDAANIQIRDAINSMTTLMWLDED